MIISMSHRKLCEMKIFFQISSFQRGEEKNMMRKPTCSNAKYLNETHRDIDTIINVVELLKFM